jgi:hypothetical protein
MNKEIELSEQDVMVVDGFFLEIARTGIVPDIDRDTLVRVFDHFGVNTESISEGAQESLKKPDLKTSFLGIREIWSDSRLDSYDVNLATFIKEYNSSHDRRLSRSKDSYSGESGLGMRRFLMYTTQLISEDISIEEYKVVVGNSCLNERLWSERKDKERIMVPGKEIPIPMMPAKYAIEFWGWVKESSKTDINA